MLAKYLTQHPQDAEAWFTLSKYVEQKERKLECLDRALRLDQSYLDAKIAKAQLTEPIPTEDIPQEAMKSAKQTIVATETLVIADEPRSTANEDKKEQKTDYSSIGYKGDITRADPKGDVVVKSVTRPTRTVKPAGDSTSKMAQYYKGLNKYQRTLFYVFWGSMIVSVPLMIIFPHSSLRLLAFALIVAYILDIIIVREKKSRKNKNTYAKGARGEIAVGSILEELGDDFMIWHDVPSKRGNIDHVVLSKSGQLFTIETKANNGQVKVSNGRILINGRPAEKDMIGQCTRNWQDLRDMVEEATGKKVFVIALLVFSYAFVERSAPVNGIRVLNKKFLKQAIQESCRNKTDKYHLCDDKVVLNKLFSEENRSYKEFSKRDFEQISGWGQN